MKNLENKLKTKWEDLKWEINWYYKEYLYHPFWSLVQGIKNFWYYRKVIWRDRWWDHSFFHNLLKAKIHNLKTHWHKDTHYVDDWNETIALYRLEEILNEIEEIEENWRTIEDYKRISELYEEFGKILFEVREFEQDWGEDGKRKIVTKKSTLFERLYD